jgi:hypothetical protein
MKKPHYVLHVRRDFGLYGAQWWYVQHGRHFTCAFTRARDAIASASRDAYCFVGRYERLP